MRLSILGLGQIGGSVARALALRAPGDWDVTAWSRSLSGPQSARADGIIRAVASSAEQAVEHAEIVLLAAPPVASRDLVGQIGPLVSRRGAILTDVTSVQIPMANAAALVDGLRFVGGHPMAGRESRGYAASTADLFVGRPWVVLPGPVARRSDGAAVAALAGACGAVPVEMAPDQHDGLVAAISHLPLLVSAALADTVVSSGTWSVAQQIAAGGWRDTTRVARGDPEMGAGILGMNSGEVLAWLGRFEAVLAEWRVLLECATPGADPALVARLERVRDALVRSSETKAP
jgi:prephenate dehydrogenase